MFSAPSGFETQSFVCRRRRRRGESRQTQQQQQQQKQQKQQQQQQQQKQQKQQQQQQQQQQEQQHHGVHWSALYQMVHCFSATGVASAIAMDGKMAIETDFQF